MWDTSDPKNYPDGECPGCAIHKRDPLAEVLLLVLASTKTASSDMAVARECARAAREHLGGEVRKQGDLFAENGDADASWVADTIARRIAMGQS